MMDIFASFGKWRVALTGNSRRAYNVITMRARLIRIGNSRGIRIPKPLLEQVGLRDTVQIRAEKGRLVIQPDKVLRQGWAEAFRAMVERGDDRPLLDQTNVFDTKEWQ
jgi:antitoxin MazE